MEKTLKKQVMKDFEQQVQQKTASYVRENEYLKNKIVDFEDLEQEYKQNMIKNEQIRKIQQHQILHLKGNMRVFARVKPFSDLELKKEQPGELINFPQLYKSKKGKVDKVQHQCLEVTMPNQGRTPIIYNFDHVFLPDQSQLGIFDEIKPFV
jgi:hypothetical protein